MKIIQCEQNSDEWMTARLGIPTASAFARILTNTGRPSTQAIAYRNTLLAERLTRMPGGYEEGSGFQGTPLTERGHALEDEARAYYEIETGRPVQRVGFVTDDHGWIGCSPDGLVAPDGVVEIKCKSPANHVAALLGHKSPEYYAQIQGQLWVTEREWCDRVFYHPLMPSIITRIMRDEPYLRLLAERLDEFVSDLAATWHKLEERKQ